MDTDSRRQTEQEEFDREAAELKRKLQETHRLQTEDIYKYPKLAGECLQHVTKHFNLPAKNFYCNVYPFDIQSLHLLSLMQNKGKKIFNQGWVYIIRDEFYLHRFDSYVSKYKLNKPVIAGVDFNYQHTYEESAWEKDCINNPNYITFSIYDNTSMDVAKSMRKDYLSCKKDESIKKKYGIELIQYPGQRDYYLYELVQKYHHPGAFDIGNTNTITLVIELEGIIKDCQEIEANPPQPVPVLDSDKLVEWWNQPCFNTLFGRGYYKVTYYNPALRKTESNKFFDFISDMDGRETMYWFDLNQIGNPFVTGQQEEVNVNDILRYISIQEYVNQIDPDKDMRNAYPRLVAILERADINQQVVDLYDLCYQYTTDEIVYYMNERNLQLANLLYHLNISYTVPSLMENEFSDEIETLKVHTNSNKYFGYRNDSECQHTSYIMPFSQYIPTRAYGDPLFGNISASELTQFSQQTVTLLTLFTTIIYQNEKVLQGLLLGTHLHVLRSLYLNSNQQLNKAWDQKNKEQRQTSIETSLNIIEGLLLGESQLDNISEQFVNKINGYKSSGAMDSKTKTKQAVVGTVVQKMRAQKTPVGRQIRGGMMNLYNAHYKQRRKAAEVAQEFNQWQSNSIYQDRYMRNIAKSIHQFNSKVNSFWKRIKPMLQQNMQDGQLGNIDLKRIKQIWVSQESRYFKFQEYTEDEIKVIEDTKWNVQKALPTIPIGLREYAQDSAIKDRRHPQVKACFAACINKDYFGSNLVFDMCKVYLINRMCKKYNVDIEAIKVLFEKIMCRYIEITPAKEQQDMQVLKDYFKRYRLYKYSQPLPIESDEDRQHRESFMSQYGIDSAWEFNDFGEVQHRLRNPARIKDYLVKDKPTKVQMGKENFQIQWPAVKYGYWPEWTQDVYRTATAITTGYYVRYGPSDVSQNTVNIYTHVGKCRYEKIYNKKNNQYIYNEQRYSTENYQGPYELLQIGTKFYEYHPDYEEKLFQPRIPDVLHSLRQIPSKDFQYFQEKWSALQELNLNEGYRINMLFRALTVKWLQVSGVLGFLQEYVDESKQQPNLTQYTEVFENIVSKTKTIFLENLLLGITLYRRQRQEYLVFDYLQLADEKLKSDRQIFSSPNELTDISQRFAYINSNQKSRLPQSAFSIVSKLGWQDVLCAVKQSVKEQIDQVVKPNIENKRYSAQFPDYLNSLLYEFCEQMLNKAELFVKGIFPKDKSKDSWQQEYGWDHTKFDDGDNITIYMDVLGRWTLQPLCKQELISSTVRKIMLRHNDKYFDKGAILPWALIDARCLDNGAIVTEECFQLKGNQTYTIPDHTKKELTKQMYMEHIEKNKKSLYCTVVEDTFPNRLDKSLIPRPGTADRQEPVRIPDYRNQFQSQWEAALGQSNSQPGTWAEADIEPFMENPVTDRFIRQNMGTRRSRLNNDFQHLTRSAIQQEKPKYEMQSQYRNDVNQEVFQLRHAALKHALFDPDYLEQPVKKKVRISRILY